MKIQGIKKYYDKEGYIVEIIKNKKEIFKSIINMNIKDIHSEVRINNNKIRVDLVCEVEDGSLVFTEVSIRDNCIKDYVNHRKHLIDILDFIGKERFAHIVLMSPDFLNDDIKEVENIISSYNVKVYFVFIPVEMISKFQNYMDFDFLDKEKLINHNTIVGNCIKITSRTVNTNKLFVFPLNNERSGNAISKAILKGLREEIYWHLAVHRYKDLKNNIIRIGTGTSDIILNIYCDMDDKVKVEVDFAKRIGILNIFKNYMADMSSEIGTSINISPNNNKIFTEIPISKNKNIAINTAINTAKGYIEYITKMYKKIQL